MLETIFASTASIARIGTDVAQHMQNALQFLQQPDFYTQYYPVIDGARARFKAPLARILQCDVSHLAAQTSTSEGIAKALATVTHFNENAMIVSQKAAFQSMRALTEDYARRGHKVACIGNDSGRLTLSDLELLDQRPDVLLVEWVNYRSGLVIDLVSIATWCRQHGTILIVDAVQGLGAADLNFDIDSLDFLASGSQKWLSGPEGAGFLYVNPKWFDAIPVLSGYASYKAQDARQLETGSLASLSFVGFEAALLALESEGYPQRVEKVQALRRLLRAAILNCADCHLLSDEGSTGDSGIISFWQEGRSASETVAALGRNGIIARERAGVVRLSPGSEVESALMLERFGAFLKGLGT